MQRYSQPLPVELMVQDPSMQVQQLQMLQQRQQLANGYNILPHPGMLYRDVAYFPTQLGNEYNVYNLPNQSNASDNKRNQEALPATSIEEAAPTKAPARGRKGSDKAGSTYASRHQAAESRRRQRINDRCAIFTCHWMLCPYAKLRQPDRWRHDSAWSGWRCALPAEFRIHSVPCSRPPFVFLRSTFVRRSCALSHDNLRNAGPTAG